MDKKEKSTKTDKTSLARWDNMGIRVISKPKKKTVKRGK